MARRAFRGRGISQSQRRKKTWVQLKFLIAGGAATPGFSTTEAFRITAPSAPDGASARSGTISASGSGIGSDPLVSSLPRESTILRVRGSLTFPVSKFDPAALQLDTAFSMGFGVTQLSDLNIDSYPGPISDADWAGWMFLRQGSQAPIDATGTIVDVKAMRKVKTDETFIIMFEAVKGDSVNPGLVGDWTIDLRLLLLLP